MTRLDHTIAREFEAALAWWHMAGVDHDFGDDATAWLADRPLDAARKSGSGRATAQQHAGASPHQASDAVAAFAGPLTAEQTVPATPRRDYLGDSPPADLAAFRQWWMESPDLDAARGFPRVSPRGEAGAALLVLVPAPESEDRERLLSGPQGRLLTNILAAMGLDEKDVYIASALPSHTPMADLGMLAAAGMDAVTAHHIGLVAPARLIAFGTGLAPMLGLPSEQPLREINYVSGKTPALSSEMLDALMDMPRLKARFWRRWMEWSATN